MEEFITKYEAGMLENLYPEAVSVIRADERARTVEKCASVARDCFWSHVGGGRIVSRQASPNEVEAAIRAALEDK